MRRDAWIIVGARDWSPSMLRVQAKGAQSAYAVTGGETDGEAQRNSSDEIRLRCTEGWCGLEHVV